MGLAQIIEPPPTKHGLDEWAFHHWAHHQAIINAAFSVKGVRLQLYQIWPIDPHNLEGWLDLHQQQHSDMNQLYGVIGADLSSVDFTNPKEAQAFFNLNYLEHQSVAQRCGVPI
jgi:hypothetical protein